MAQRGSSIPGDAIDVCDSGIHHRATFLFAAMRIRIPVTYDGDPPRDLD